MDLIETGGFSSAELIAEAQTLTLDSLTLREAVSIGQYTTDLAEKASGIYRSATWSMVRISHLPGGSP